jgi:lipopolysaccharide/colanic/teichoic acid biosynthesis glycosyltransferase
LLIDGHCIQLEMRLMRSSIDPSTDIPPSVPYANKGDDGHSFGVLSASEVGPWPNSMGKRIFDILVSGSLLIVSAPLLLAIALFIKLTSRGPVLFSQLRMGKGLVAFPIYKFRTMRVTQTNGPLVTSRNDSRITFAGKVLRRFKLDELPQLYNVLRGDMSCVGPRPKVVGHEHKELRCKPGLTGAATLIFAHEDRLLAQIPDDKVESFTVEVLNRIKCQVDREYELDSTFLTDLKILMRTPIHISGLRPATTLQELPGNHYVKHGPVLVPAKRSHEAEPIIFQGFPPVDQSIATERSQSSIY